MSPDTQVPAERSVKYYSDGRVGHLTLNRPEKRNAMSPSMRSDFHAALQEFIDDPGARVGVLSGAGPTFCAGFDLASNSPSAASTVSDPWNDRNRLTEWMGLALAIWECPKPIIAQVHGHCLAGGILFLVASDLVAISGDCAVGWPRLPMGAGFLDGALSLLVGQRRAKELAFFVGSRMSGLEAKDWGLANWAFPTERLEEETLRLAREMAKAPLNVLQIRKASLNKVHSHIGFREALLGGAEWDALAHADPAVDEYRGLVRKHGMKTVIAAYEGHEDGAAFLASADAK